MKKFLLLLVTLLSVAGLTTAKTLSFGDLTIPGLPTASGSATDNAVTYESSDLGVTLSLVQCYKGTSASYLMAVKEKAAISFTTPKEVKSISIKTSDGKDQLAANGTLALYSGDKSNYDAYNICNTISTTYTFVPSITAAGTKYTLKNIFNPENSSKSGNVQIAELTITYADEDDNSGNTGGGDNNGEGEGDDNDDDNGDNTGDVYSLVTNINELITPAKCIIVYNGNTTVAMGSQNSGNYRNKVDVTIKDNKIVPGNDVAIVTIEKVGETYTLNTTEGYLHPHTSGNSMTSTTTLADDCKATITISDKPDNKATITFSASTNKANTLQYNTGSPRFSCYAGTQQAVQIYMNQTGVEAPEIPENQVATPVINPNGGMIGIGEIIYITTETDGADIYYTIDGSDPDKSSIKYTENGIEVERDFTLKAIAVKENMTDSFIAEATFTTFDTNATSGTFDFTNPTGLSTSITPNETASQGVDIKSGTSFISSAATLTIIKGTSNTDPRIWTASNGNSGVRYELRVYNGCSFNVSVPAQMKITKIEFGRQSGGNSNFSITPDAGTLAINNPAVWTPTTNAEDGVALVAEEEELEVSSVTFTVTGTTYINSITVTYDLSTGVSEIEETTAEEPVFYNLQGVRVKNPERGIYIRVQGNKTSKVIF